MIRTILTACFAITTLMSFSTFGAEEKSETNWRGVFIAGANFSGKTDYTTKSSTGVSVTSSDKANAQALLGAEITYQAPQLPLGGSLIFEGTKYKYDDGSGIADGEKALLFMPRIAGKIGPAEIWAGMGLGLMFLSIGGPYSQTANNVTVTLLNTSATSFAWSPRIGADFDVNEHLFMGAQFSYIQSAASIAVTVTSGSTTVPLTEDFTRHWVSLAFRVGSKF